MATEGKATLGGGCFWCLEAVYAELKGVHGVVSGYMGGVVERPAYQQVCTGTTGHAEVVQLTFDPVVISFREILEVFFTIHDPTTKDRQGNDAGPQYRSVIYFHSDAQKKTAEKLIEELTLARVFHDAIVTEVSPAAVFYPAEEYHQNYFAHHPHQPYCMFVVAPKLEKFRSKFEGMRRQES